MNIGIVLDGFIEKVCKLESLDDLGDFIKKKFQINLIKKDIDNLVLYNYLRVYSEKYESDYDEVSIQIFRVEVE